MTESTDSPYLKSIAEAIHRSHGGTLDVSCHDCEQHAASLIALIEGDGYELVPSWDLLTLVHFAHAWAVEHRDKVDDEEAELVERYMRAEHGGESDPDCSLGRTDD